MWGLSDALLVHTYALHGYLIYRYRSTIINRTPLGFNSLYCNCNLSHIFSIHTYALPASSSLQYSTPFSSENMSPLYPHSFHLSVYVQPSHTSHSP